VTMAQAHQLFKGASRWKPSLANNSHTNHYHQLQDDIVLIFYKDWDLCNMGKKFVGLPPSIGKVQIILTIASYRACSLGYVATHLHFARIVQPGKSCHLPHTRIQTEALHTLLDGTRGTHDWCI
jgi:hypothetical protein